MTVVVDASAAIEIALNTESARALRETLDDSELVLAPDTYPAEVTNVFWKYARFSNIPGEKCQIGISYCLDLVDDYINTQHICREVFSESLRSKHSAYDMFYLIVARRNDAVVVTRDRKLIETARLLGVETVGTS